MKVDLPQLKSSLRISDFIVLEGEGEQNNNVQSKVLQ